MNTKKHAQPGFLDLRASVILLLCVVTSSIVAGTLLGFFRPETQAGVSQRTLTFEERVAYQRAIEEVYWRHRLWPRSGGERPDPKPSLDAVMSQEQLEKKVEDYLHNSQALEDYWQRPITASSCKLRSTAWPSIPSSLRCCANSLKHWGTIPLSSRRR